MSASEKYAAAMDKCRPHDEAAQQARVEIRKLEDQKYETENMIRVLQDQQRDTDMKIREVEDVLVGHMKKIAEYHMEAIAV